MRLSMPQVGDEPYLTLTFLALYLPSGWRMVVDRNGNSGFRAAILDPADNVIGRARSYVVANKAGEITYGVRVTPEREQPWAMVERLRSVVPYYGWNDGL
jgi:hypothetical protein